LVHISSIRAIQHEEKPIESKEVDNVNPRNEHKPFFEQLRKNQEEDNLKKEDERWEMMWGTRAFDKQDVAHLDALIGWSQKRGHRRSQAHRKSQSKRGLSEAPKKTGATNKEKGQHNAGLGSLLCGYGSSDDDSE